MKAVLDHVGIAVHDLQAALAFYRDALGLEVEAAEEVASQRVRAHFLPVGPSKLELLEATGSDSAIAKYVARRGPGLHHITLRVEDIGAALAQLKARGARLVDETPRPGAEGALVAFVHPSSAHGVLVELKQQVAGAGAGLPVPVSDRDDRVTRYTLGDLELISVCDGGFRLDGGSVFGAVPRTRWEHKARADDRNRILLAMRPLVVRGTRTMLVDAGVGDKYDATFADFHGLDRARNLDHTLAEAGLGPEDIDLVLATHLHFDHAGGFTCRDRAGRVRPRFPRAQYVVRRGEWEDATHTNARSRESYFADDYVPLAEAGRLQLVDDDQTIMPGVKVRRTGGHTRHHQMVLIESGGNTAAYAGDLMPTTAHLSESWILGDDLYPADTLAAKAALLENAIEHRWLLFFAHDPLVPAGYIREDDGEPRAVRALPPAGTS